MQINHVWMLLVAFVLVAFVLVSCATPERKNILDEPFKKSSPKSILIIPPLNDSVEVNAPYVFLSTISKAVAEKGYYVFPVAVIDNYFKQNGLPTTAEMNNASVEKLVEHLNPDAIMYIRINRWGQKYQVLDSTSVVNSELTLVDSRTQEIIWQSNAVASMSNTVAGGDTFLEIIVSAMISAIFGQIVGQLVDNTQQLSYEANNRSVNNGQTGLLDGPYMPIEPNQE
ncbi:DUF799 domain-containing protein [Marinicellulosiphila megalodicopiae]|uniref:DUF799 domain-containing protein n=1 Tax=Marinicellulosiphila megalodicopiae TaxID=2724896 RepID=UPI003BB02209